MVLLAFTWFSGCRAPEPGRPADKATDDGTPTETAHTGLPAPTHSGRDSGTTADTGAHSGADFDCSTVQPGTVSFVSTNAITTEEDFDFDATGLLLAQNFYSIKGTDRTGVVTVIASGLSGDAAGIRTLPTGDFVYASPDDGRVVGVDRYTGASITLLSGLRSPNSLEVGIDGVVYSSEFSDNGRVLWLDVATRDSGEITQLDFVNGMTLSNDEQILYMSSASNYWSGRSAIYAIDRQADGLFGGPVRLIAEAPQLVTSLAIDVCDNLYMVAYSNGSVYRFDPDVGAFDQLADLGGYGGYSSVRFAPGLGGYGNTYLYATNRLLLYEIAVGVPGRHVLAP